eukprot:11514198-Alexandrium_andersonii.AAC.1
MRAAPRPGKASTLAERLIRLTLARVRTGVPSEGPGHQHDTCLHTCKDGSKPRMQNTLRSCTGSGLSSRSVCAHVLCSHRLAPAA